MIEIQSLLVFAAVNLVVLVTPGPAVLYTVSRSLDQGRRAGLLSVWGLALGTLPHALAVALGVASLLTSSPVALDVLKYLGAACLVILGIGRLRQRRAVREGEPGRPGEGGAAFVQSFLVGVFNPKALLFFMALLPQFLDPARGHPAVQTLVLWLISQVMAVGVGSAYAVAAASLRGLLRRRKSSRIGDYLAGGVYLGLGVVAALSGSKSR